MQTAELEAPPRLGELANRLDCFTESDLILLVDVNQDTLAAWRKRGQGPTYVRAGNRFLYPRASVAEWLQARLCERKPVDARGVL